MRRPSQGPPVTRSGDIIVTPDLRRTRGTTKMKTTTNVRDFRKPRAQHDGGGGRAAPAQGRSQQDQSVFESRALPDRIVSASNKNEALKDVEFVPARRFAKKNCGF